MSNDEIGDLMQAPTPTGGPGPDLTSIRRRGRRRRRVRRVATGSCAAVVVVGLAGVALTLTHGRGDERIAPATPDRTGLSAYEKRVLRDVPSAYAVDGTVVLPDRAPAGSRPTGPLPRVTGTPVPLGFHGRTGPGYLGSTKADPAYQHNAPRGSQVVIDPGPLSIGCTGADRTTCSIVTLAPDASGRLFELTGYGTEKFLRPGAPMEVFLDDDWSDHQHRYTVIGGFAGTTAVRVRLDLVDGTSTDATLARGTLRQGATLFWARTTSQVLRVRTFTADGRVLDTHQVRACSGGVDCEVR